MVSLTAFSHIVSLIYAAALTSVGWDDAMAEVHRGFADPGNGCGIVRSTSLAFAGGASRSVIGTLLPEAEKPYRSTTAASTMSFNTSNEGRWVSCARVTN